MVCWQEHHAISNNDVWLKQYLFWEQLTNVLWGVPGYDGGWRGGERKPLCLKGSGHLLDPHRHWTSVQWHASHEGEATSQRHRGRRCHTLLLPLGVYTMLGAPGGLGHCLRRTQPVVMGRPHCWPPYWQVPLELGRGASLSTDPASLVTFGF